MKATNETCVQQVRVIFFKPEHPSSSHRLRLLGWPSFKRTGPFSGTASPNASQQQAQARWDKILNLIGLLQNLHEDWQVYTNRRQLVMETSTLDFHPISELLEQQGLPHSEYELRVEYERKWGML
ncbi:hypothetical protein AWM70_00360 [Paenibacillus yonginensis]|uniref:Uncharacterized protein n=1 Tax=Paenibacillus yonginensis TaxID=1462996 RepID=A0A1B1MVP1_9BACL|nr:hypothetical protein [Paenibacillus yonginensis]ANS73225.1 hypothetical protein AWM70_00360 [Paenibacillus yonginensis]